MRTFFSACLLVILKRCGHGDACHRLLQRTPASAPLGVVLQADNAQVLELISQLGGATVYDGDNLRTETGGALRAQLGGPQVYLRSSSNALVHSLPNGFSAELGEGTVVVSSNPGQTFQLIADGATITPAGAQGTVAQITRVSPTELLLNSTRGALEITMGDEVKTIEAGTSYRMEVEADDSGPQPQGPYHTARNRFVIWLIIGASVATGVLIWRALVSPDGF